MSGPLPQLLLQHRAELRRYVQRRAGRVLLRFESTEDLVQSVQVEALAAEDRFEAGTDEEFRAWLFLIARRLLARRREHWFALKRHGGRLIRMTLTGGDGERTPLPLPAADTGPATLADRRELLLLATRALDLLSERDRVLIEGTLAGQDRHELAQRVSLSVPAAERARLRAAERLRKTFRLLSRARGQGQRS